MPTDAPDLNSGQTVPASPIKLLVAASGTGGHLYPALAAAEALEAQGYDITWLGVNNRLETSLLPSKYPLVQVPMEGFQTRLGPKTGIVLSKLVRSIRQTRRLLQQGQFQGVITTGGYIAAPAIIAARSLGLPSILHESNVLPGKVTRWFSRWCSVVALGFEATTQYLPKANAVTVGTPVRANFMSPTPLDFDIPDDVLLMTVAGGSQGAVAVNRLARKCAPAWLEAGVWIVHLTGERDDQADSFTHPHYRAIPFCDNMAGLLQRTNLAISRAGAGTLTELATTHTPSILIPYPYAAEDHQAYNAEIFVKAGAARMFREAELTDELFTKTVLDLLRSQPQLKEMAAQSQQLSTADSTEKFAQLIREVIQSANLR
ncbi:UDP-N-acetylglucosamine--N-acetylmuramyl- (pentapeptide) pyrophosphoryl-undecaprenol N-acetylglucosamine transferase [Acaryochloris thomasi RCC1774]|uniref:UDP-N-acetylglucosamine--N-acetylmuramyl-(pentapeptide) pyrophosphoryl-undecaprenol N-acetylglucosamine transferase n=1 Tax=Acaryochloris thomasi RCC1774 TaxID=1764569 RepID=A0A2W1JK52_9CYAN|nr:undecaprenyldiphospho-muramoylpentapeptide beta-N-acetylglucosaminyltransferase [Acaryochloris thomasi]PZD73788.1 UDP-N-acetylglucosamine--N-acetylmuramyl- (pentapeptide) pyrophosphoryl-undecaprenol N-acetylglucosamine transferase [Acaryochloris thomasi RCC1774]